jgi:hypothetical protein
MHHRTQGSGENVLLIAIMGIVKLVLNLFSPKYKATCLLPAIPLARSG